MAYIQGSAIEKVRIGSIEHKLGDIHDFIQEKYKDALRIIATFDDHVLAFNGEGKLRNISFLIDEDGKMRINEDKASRSIPIIKEEEIPSHVSKELKSIAKSMMNGDDVLRTRVRELVPFINDKDMIWFSDIMNGIKESTKPNEWSKMYEANVERIKTRLYGRIRDIEGGVPKTRYSRLPEERIYEFAKEVNESMSILLDRYKIIIEGCKDLSFCDNKFLGAVCESLIVEAQAAVSLLGKAEKLSRHEDLPLVAKAHDKLADRARTMVLLSEYLKLKAKPNNKER
jgi:hypothetical protein